MIFFESVRLENICLEHEKKHNFFVLLWNLFLKSDSCVEKQMTSCGSMILIVLNNKLIVLL